MWDLKNETDEAATTYNDKIVRLRALNTRRVYEHTKKEILVE